MRLVIQRVNHASVTIDGSMHSKIGKGLLVFVGVGDSDDEKTADLYLKKLLNLRIFADEEGKTNLSLKDVGGELLFVSQFTLYANCRKGNRPSFVEAGAPDRAEALYRYMVQEATLVIPQVKQGVFGADMKIELENDGPFTIVLDDRLFEK